MVDTTSFNQLITVEYLQWLIMEPVQYDYLRVLIGWSMAELSLPMAVPSVATQALSIIKEKMGDRSDNSMVTFLYLQWKTILIVPSS